MIRDSCCPCSCLPRFAGKKEAAPATETAAVDNGFVLSSLAPVSSPCNQRALARSKKYLLQIASQKMAQQAA